MPDDCLSGRNRFHQSVFSCFTFGQCLSDELPVRWPEKFPGQKNFKQPGSFEWGCPVVVGTVQIDMHVIFSSRNGEMAASQRTDVPVCFLWSSGKPEQDVTGIVVALLERVFQQFADGQGTVPLRIAVA